MLLLNRRTNESVTAWVNDHEPLLIRVNEVSLTGSVLLGFEGENHQVCRTEIFHDFKDRNSEEEYRAKVAEIQKQHKTQEALNKVAEQHFAQRKPRGLVQRRPTLRKVVPRVQPIRGILAPEPRTSPFMGLLAVSGSKP